MRIGEFAKKHGVTQDTIRHYLEMGLLVAEKKGGHYKFNESDSRDINKIIELKQLEFSLTEIQKVLTFQRLSGSNTDVFRKLYLSFLEEKQKEVTYELAKYSRMNEFLREKIQVIKAESLRDNQELGFPLTSLGILACPQCHNSMDMSDGTIERNMVMEASMHCRCGYKAIIRNGIYIDETAVRTKMQNGKRMPTKEEYLESATPAHVNFLYRGMTFLIEYINKYGKQPKYMLELSDCVGFFLLQYIKDLAADTTFILIDYDLERIAQLKKNLEMYYEHKNFIFLCCDYHRMPVAASVVDIIVDYGETKNYAHSTGKFLIDRISSFLTKDGLLTASFHFNGPNSKSNVNLKPESSYCENKESMLAKLKEANFEPLEIAMIGPSYESNSNNSDQREIEIYQCLYAGRKGQGSGAIS